MEIKEIGTFIKNIYKCELEDEGNDNNLLRVELTELDPEQDDWYHFEFSKKPESTDVLFSGQVGLDYKSLFDKSDADKLEKWGVLSWSIYKSTIKLSGKVDSLACIPELLTWALNK